VRRERCGFWCQPRPDRRDPWTRFLGGHEVRQNEDWDWAVSTGGKVGAIRRDPGLETTVIPAISGGISVTFRRPGPPSLPDKMGVRP
jgi:hypothetical protein